MGPTNGQGGELAAALERIVAAFGHLNRGLNTLSDRVARLSESSSASSERREREFEILRTKLDDLGQKHVVLSMQLTEARDDIEGVRTDFTPPLGVPLYNPAKDPPKNGSGSLVAFARLAEKVPTPWVGWLLKLGLSAGFGGAALRFIQWMTSGH